VALVFALSGCERPHSDMGAQDKYVTYEPSAFFADGASARPLVAGVVPRDDESVPGWPSADHRPAGPALLTELAPPDATSPLTVTAETIDRGQEQFETYCAVCHGRLGNGDGMIVRRGFTRPPSFHVDRLKQAPDAHFYNVVTQGYGAMFGYGDRVAPERRWEIVAYVRALQAAPQAAGAAFTEADRRALIGAGDRQTPVAGGGR
jgi:mono/diheme cytochrome c family protein